MERIRDDFVARARARAAAGDPAGARAELQRAARVWPVEDEQLADVQRALDAALLALGRPPRPLPDPNRPG